LQKGIYAWAIVVEDVEVQATSDLLSRYSVARAWFSLCWQNKRASWLGGSSEK